MARRLKRRVVGVRVTIPEQQRIYRFARSRGLCASSYIYGLVMRDMALAAPASEPVAEAEVTEQAA